MTHGQSCSALSGHAIFPGHMKAKPHFHLGQLVCTPGIMAAFNLHEITELLLRHISHDWGDLCKSDKQMNEAALTSGDRILSCYQCSHGRRVYIITEAVSDVSGQRDYTTILLPSEY